MPSKLSHLAKHQLPGGLRLFWTLSISSSLGKGAWEHRKEKRAKLEDTATSRLSLRRLARRFRWNAACAVRSDLLDWSCRASAAENRFGASTHSRSKNPTGRRRRRFGDGLSSTGRIVKAWRRFGPGSYLSNSLFGDRIHFCQQGQVCSSFYSGLITKGLV
ncbi:hypothetical protein IWX50DRAFT_466274 [Phyllosticta citricarpa]